ncbi:MAG: DUF2007 domain-containing protein [Kiritimatiellae bacterium]|nr:DUF2007 domain-containing protein [Kiritimatiellia bacterium]
MKLLWTGNDPVIMSILRAELTSREIPFIVKNEALGVALGELPPVEIWPELWVGDDTQFDEAEEVLRDLQSAAEGDAPPA